MVLRFALVSVLLLFAKGVCAIDLLPPELDALRQDGMSALFNMNYDLASETFQKMIDSNPEHPAGHIYMANAIWLRHLSALRRLQTNIYNRGNSFFGKKEDVVDPKVDKAFRKQIDQGIALCEARLKTNKNDVPSQYYLGIARNILAGYEATVKRSFFSALRNGSKGVGSHREIVEKHPDVIDAQLSVGMYNYVVGSLPLAVKILAFIGGMRGSKKEGIATLENVAKKGVYARDESKVLLIMLYNREKRTADALKMLNDLVIAYPQNSLFRLERAMTLGQLKRFTESTAEFERLLQDPSAVSYVPDLIHFQYGMMLSDAGRWQEAHGHYVAAYESPKAPPALATLAHLRSGNCLDVIGKRDDAVAEYRIVMKREDVFDSHDDAKEFLKQPFQPVQ